MFVAASPAAHRALIAQGMDRRPKLKEEQPDMPFGEIGKTLGAEWKQMSENEKKPYEKKAAEAKKGAHGCHRSH